MNWIWMSICCVLLVFSSPALAAPFTKGNFLVLRAAGYNGASQIAPGYIQERTLDGDLVQEIALPTTTNASGPACLVINEFYQNMMNLDTEGSRVIIPCFVPTDVLDRYINGFGIIYANGTIEVSTVLSDDGAADTSAVYNAVLDGDRIYFATNHYEIRMTTIGATNSTIIAEEDALYVQIFNGQLYCSNDDDLPDGLMRIGSGLPTEPSSTLTNYLNDPMTVGGFAFVNNNSLYLTALPNINKYWIENDIPQLNESFTSDSLEFHYIAALVQDDGSVVLIIGSSNGTVGTTGYAQIWKLVDNGSTFDITVMSSLDSNDEYMIKSPIVAPYVTHCYDGKKSGDESDVDCGGSCTQKCEAGQGCYEDLDCVSGGVYCIATICAANPNPTMEPIIINVPLASPSKSNSPAKVSTSGSPSIFSNFFNSILMLIVYNIAIYYFFVLLNKF